MRSNSTLPDDLVDAALEGKDLSKVRGRPLTRRADCGEWVMGWRMMDFRLGLKTRRDIIHVPIIDGSH